MSKIISERCELVKLCHINRGGAVFLRHSACSVHVFELSFTKFFWK